MELGTKDRDPALEKDLLVKNTMTCQPLHQKSLKLDAINQDEVFELQRTGINEDASLTRACKDDPGPYSFSFQGSLCLMAPISVWLLNQW